MTAEELIQLAHQYRDASALEVAQRLCEPRGTLATEARVFELAREAGHDEETARAISDALAQEHAAWYATTGRALGIGTAPRTKPGRGNGIRGSRERRYGRRGG